jgi:hypothetical protein
VDKVLVADDILGFPSRHRRHVAAIGRRHQAER